MNLLLLSPEHHPREVEEALNRIFSDPIYRDTTRRYEVDSGLVSWYERLVQGWNDFWTGFWSGVGDWRLESPVFFWMVVAALSLGVFWLIVRFVRDGGPGRSAVSASEPTAGERRERAAAHWDRAHDLAERGRYPDALRYLMLALADSLLRDEHHRFRPAWTNHELSASLRREGVEDPDFEALVDSLDRAWYGSGHADAVDFRRGREAVARLANLPGARA